MKKMMRTMGLVGMVGLASSLSAEDMRRFDVGVALPWAQDNLKDITKTRNISGAVLDFGYNGRLANTDIPFRTALGVNWFPGKERDGIKQSLMGLQLASDIFVKLGDGKLNLVTGISLNQWKHTLTPAVPDHEESVKGVKFGGRLGLNYQFSNRLTGQVMLQVVEMGTNADASLALNPSWVQFGIKYGF